MSRRVHVGELLIVVAIIGTIAAIAIPNLLRARLSANESRAIGDTRTVISAMHSYSTANCGYFTDKLECLTRTGGMMGGICIPGYPDLAPEFLSGDLGQKTPYERSGYLRDYVAFGDVMLGGGMMGMGGGSCDSMSRLNFCYIADRANPGITGVRSFSGVAAGAIYADPSGTSIACPVPPSTMTLD